MNKASLLIFSTLLCSCTLNINITSRSSNQSSLSSIESINSSFSETSSEGSQVSSSSTNSESSSKSDDSSLSSNYSSSSLSSLTSTTSSSLTSSISSSSEIDVDPYSNVSKTEFYNNYTPATSYKDAYYRTLHGLMSGSIEETPTSYLPVATNKFGDNIKISDGIYTYRSDNTYESFKINNSDTIIYYGGAYITLEEVAAYIQAFGEVPPNNNYDKGADGKRESLAKWGRYGRVNIGYFSGDTTRFPTEPLLPELDTKSYIETDIGSLGGFECGGTVKPYYNDGSISRGVCRIVFTSKYRNNAKITDISERHVFYTYNHYNDFQEYLNCYQSWGVRFGNESAGNAYGEENSSNPPSAYPNVILKKLNEVLN